MERLEVKRHKGNYEISVRYGRDRGVSYNNVIDKDPNKIAQILIDLNSQGFPIIEAIKIVAKRVENHDWFGIG